MSLDTLTNYSVHLQHYVDGLKKTRLCCIMTMPLCTNNPHKDKVQLVNLEELKWPAQSFLTSTRLNIFGINCHCDYVSDLSIQHQYLTPQILLAKQTQIQAVHSTPSNKSYQTSGGCMECQRSSHEGNVHQTLAAVMVRCPKRLVNIVSISTIVRFVSHL